ncbi:MAG: DUF4115 domain-containing protein, partial [Alphaproteobacteria bacterium]|nr:DUF4115 domain-containing protein [Alphaproteobacteria bacterium]
MIAIRIPALLAALLLPALALADPEIAAQPDLLPEPVQRNSALTASATPEVPPPARAASSSQPARTEPPRIVLAAIEDAWIRVRDEAGGVLFMRTLATGERYEVPARADLLLDTGNAEGLTVTVDGAEAPSLFIPGRSVVRRGIRLDPDELLKGPPPAMVATAAKVELAQAVLRGPAASPTSTPTPTPAPTSAPVPAATPAP